MWDQVLGLGMSFGPLVAASTFMAIQCFRTPGMVHRLGGMLWIWSTLFWLLILSFFICFEKPPHSIGAYMDVALLSVVVLLPVVILGYASVSFIGEICKSPHAPKPKP